MAPSISLSIPFLKTSSSQPLTTYANSEAQSPNDVMSGLNVGYQDGEGGGKRFPVLGPTRKDTELYFGMERGRGRSPPDDHISRPTSGARSRTRTPVQARHGLRTEYHGERDPSLRDRHQRSSINSKPPVAQSKQEDQLQQRTCNSPLKQVDGSAWQEEEHDDQNSFYCVIRSANIKQSWAEAGTYGRVKHSRQIKDIVNGRGNQSYVLTADTASLSLQSGPPLVIRSATDIYSRDNIRSAIQKVSDANINGKNGIAHARRSKSSSIFGARNYANGKNGNFLTRSSSLHSAPCEERILHRSRPQGVRDSSNLSAASYKYSSEETVYRLSGHSLKRLGDSTNLDSFSDVISQEWQEIDVGQSQPPVYPSFLRTRTAPDPQQLHDLAMASRSLGKKLSKTSNSKRTAKTLSPSKYGYHPRSQSPTFKRLVAASERLLQTVKPSEDSPPESVYVCDHHYGSTSSDSLKGLHALGGDGDPAASDSPTTQNTSFSHKRRPREKDKSALNDQTNKFKIRPGVDVIKPTSMGRNHWRNCQRDISLERNDVRPGTPSEDLTIVNDESYLANILTHRDTYPSQEMDNGSMEGQPTQLHFFLPQLADSMSEVSGPTLTGRSHYQEERLELWSRRECGDNQGRKKSLHDTNNDKHTHQHKQQSIQNAENSPKLSANVKQTKPAITERRGRNVSKERLTARDIKNGHLTSNAGHTSPSTEEALRPKRHVSPMRIVQKGERPSRKKTSFPVRQASHLDAHLPGETLKKQLEDFPTLVSMEADSTLPVR